MGILIIIMIIVVPVVILLFISANSTTKEAKKDAEQILKLGYADDIKKMKQTMEILKLSMTLDSNDLEAADLWKRLQTIKMKCG